MIERFDYGILEMFQQMRSGIMTLVFHIFTLLGEGGAVWIVAGIVLFLIKDKRKYGIIVLASLLLCLLFINGILKNVVVRPRPCWRHPEVEMLISVPRDYSFPSGHTASSFAACVSIAYWNRRYGAAALTLALAIAASRLYFFVHYPTDILAGAIFGSILAVISIGIVETLAEKRKKTNLI